MYKIKPVNNKISFKDFIEFPYTLYKDNKYWLPPIKSDEKKHWKNHPALKFSDLQMWVVYLKDRPIGRIAAIINHEYNKKTGNDYGRISGLEFYNDEKGFGLLMNTAIAWLKKKGMKKVHGPLGYTNLDTQGMLIEGFDYLPSVASVYHLPYYKTHMQKYGFEKENDWIEFHLKLTKQAIQKGEKGAMILEKRYGFKLINPKSKKDFEPYADTVFEIINNAYQNLPYVMELNNELKQYYKSKYFNVLNPKYIFFVKDKEKVVGFLVGIPSLSKALKKANGKIFPFGWYHIMKAIKNPEEIDLALVGSLPEYHTKGVAALLFKGLHEELQKNDIVDMETTGVFETNQHVISNWKNYDHIQHKRRRTWIMDIE